MRGWNKASLGACLTAWLNAGCVVGIAHDVTLPDGYEALHRTGQTTLLQPRGWSNITWSQWEGDDTRVQTELVTYSHERTPDDLTLDVEFVLTLVKNGRTDAMTCTTRPPHGDVFRLQCTMPSDSSPVVYTMAPDHQQCATSAYGHGTSDDPQACWHGRLDTASDTYAVEFGFTTRWNSPVANLVWRDASGQPVQVSDFLSARGIAPIVGVNNKTPVRHKGAHPFRSSLQLKHDAAAGPDADTLMLNAVAVHIWFEMLRNASDHSAPARRQFPKSRAA